MSDKKFFGILILGLAVTILFVGLILSPKSKPGGEEGSGNQTWENEIAQQGNIKSFQSREEIKTFLQENETESTRGYIGRDTMEAPMDTATPDTSFGARATKQMESAAPSPESREHSETNIQVKGVDEADIVKNDGEYIYTVSNEDLFIIKSYPAQDSEIVSQIKFDSRPKNIYLNQDKLAVFGRNHDIHQKEGVSNLRDRETFTFFKVFDISDKSNPNQVRDLNLEGSYFDSRMIGDYVYFITSNQRYHYLEDGPVLPRVIEDGNVLTDKNCQGSECLKPNVYHFDIPYDNYNFTNVAAINIQDDQEKINSEMYLFSDNQNMYVSTDNIYITYTKRVNRQKVMTEITLDAIRSKLDSKEQQKIDDIKQAESHVLPQEEKWRKIQQVIEKHIQKLDKDKQQKLEEQMEKKVEDKWTEIRKKLEQTVIHKIAINEDNLEYKTQGEVSGHVLNQFSMSEQGDHFRIATTKNQDWGGPMPSGEENESYSNVYVLNQDLDVVGSVEKLAPGERIYSARFMQDRVYLVTFKQMDPLFVIDLANPESPEVLGELKIPGFSNYLHPYDKDTLIGIGKDTEATKWGVDEKGLKLALFDVSNVNDPKQIDTQILGSSGSDSIALDNHKAFLFDKEKNLISIPVKLRSTSTVSSSIQEEPRSTSTVSSSIEEERVQSPAEPPREDIIRRPRPRYDYFRGAAVLHVDKENLKLRGKIQHGEGEDHSNQIKRSLYIEDTLYTLSDDYLKMNNLDDLESIKELNLEMEKEGDFQVIN